MTTIGVAHKRAWDSSEPCNHEIDQTRSREIKSARTDPAAAGLAFQWTACRSLGPQSPFNEGCVRLRELVARDRLQSMVQFNYCIDLDWFMAQLAPFNRGIPIVLVHGLRGPDSRQQFNLALKRFPNVRAVLPDLPIAFGTHHTKMMLLFQEHSCRVVIHTANLVSYDWADKTQAVWCSPPLPLQQEPLSTSTSQFGEDLMAYLRVYGSPLQETVERLSRHDFGSCKAVLIASVPGRHSGISRSRWGHLRLREALKRHAVSTDPQNDSILCQYSSCGSLGTSSDSWLTGEFLESLGTLSGMDMDKPSASQLKLIFPTVENVRQSFEGYEAGASIPFDAKNLNRQAYMLRYLHQWRAESSGRSRAMPHIKTYARLDSTYRKVVWCLLTSANLSKAAWGNLERNRSQMMIRSYEVGVLFTPDTVHESLGLFGSGSGVTVPLPYDLPPVPYSANDDPWTWNSRHDTPDRFGKVWP